MRILIIILLFSGALSAQINPDYIPEIPEVLGADVFYTPSRSRLYKVRMDSVLAYIQRNLPLSGGMTSFDVASDEGLGDVITVTDGDTFTIAGGTNGIDTDRSGGTINVTLDVAEIAVDVTPSSSTFLVGMESGNPGNWLYDIDALATYFNIPTLLSELTDDIRNATHASSITNGRLAQWSGTGGELEDAPISNAGTYLEFTQSTGVRIPDGNTFFRPTANDGMIRYNTEVDEYEGVKDGNWKTIQSGGVESFNVSSGGSLSPSSDFLIIASPLSGGGTATITEDDLNAGHIMYVFNQGPGALTLDGDYSFFDVSTGSSATVSIPNDTTAMFIFRGFIGAPSWYRIY